MIRTDQPSDFVAKSIREFCREKSIQLFFFASGKASSCGFGGEMYPKNLGKANGFFFPEPKAKFARNDK